MEHDQELFRGVWVPLITPIDENDNIMFGTIKNHIETLGKTRHTGVILFSPYGEGQSLSFEEKIGILKYIRDSFTDLKIIVGIISTSQKDAIKLIQKAAEFSVNGILLYSPYDYGKITVKKLAEYFNGLIKATELPVLISHMDMLTRVSITTTVLRILRRNTNFKGVVDHSKNINFIQMVSKSYKALDVLSANEHSHHIKISHGAKGIVSYLCNVYPILLCGTYNFENNVQNGIQDQYLQQKEPLQQILKIVESYPMPDVLKYLLYLQGFPAIDTRVPLETLSEDQKSKLKTDIGKFLKKNTE